MAEDKDKKLAENLPNKVQQQTPKEQHYKDSADTPDKKITDIGIQKDSQTQTIIHLLNKIDKK